MKKVQTRTVKMVRVGNGKWKTLSEKKKDFPSCTKAARFFLNRDYKSGNTTQSAIARMLNVSIPLVNDEAKKMGLVGTR